jgi:MSHA biogenesis protein MshK
MAFKRFFMLPLCVLALPLMASAQGAEELIDPTRPVAFVAPVGKKTPEENKLQLQAIFSGEGRREAVINGQTVKVGDVVDQAKILAIGPGRVSFEKNGEKGELVLLPTVSKPVRVEE